MHIALYMCACTVGRHRVTGNKEEDARDNSKRKEEKGRTAQSSRRLRPRDLLLGWTRPMAPNVDRLVGAIAIAVYEPARASDDSTRKRPFLKTDKLAATSVIMKSRTKKDDQ